MRKETEELEDLKEEFCDYCLKTHLPDFCPTQYNDIQDGDDEDAYVRPPDDAWEDQF